ncbi:MAG: AmmeMemoRadiSam system radical SAM enzyme [Bacillota bacterium]
MPKEAMYYEKVNERTISCSLCPHGCVLQEGKTGICKARENIGGVLYSNNYGEISAIAMDPIEKKPLYHFYPGKYLLSIGSTGCNFRCDFCQNFQIAQKKSGLHTPAHSLETGYLVKLCRDEEDCIGIAYTYNEPSIWYEYVYDTSQYVKEKEFKNIMVTNGYMSPEPFKELLPYIDAFNIDVKAFSEKYYKEICGGKLENVKRTVELAADKAHVELTTLIVPGLNDSDDEIAELAKWISEMKPSIPLHLTRYYPQYKMSLPSTPVETIKRLKRVAEEYLEYVYTGNIYGEDSNTYCPECKALLVRRGNVILYEHLEDGVCTKCGKEIDIIGTKDLT